MNQQCPKESLLTFLMCHYCQQHSLSIIVCPSPVLNHGPRECSGCELVMTFPSRPLQWLPLDPRIKCRLLPVASRAVWSDPVPPSLSPSPSSALLFLPKAFPATGHLHMQLFHLECLFLPSLHLAGPSYLWVPDGHLTMTSPPHLQTWFPSPPGLLSPPPVFPLLHSILFWGAHWYQLSSALIYGLREDRGCSLDTPSA